MLLCVLGSAASGALYLLTSSAIWLGVPQILSWYVAVNFSPVLLFVH